MVALHVFSFGLTSGICQIIAGIKWLDIHPQAQMIEQPGVLVGAVTEHLKVATDEEGSCRRARKDGRCVESDFVFTLAEQARPAVDGDARVQARVVKAGHVEIVGETGEPPVKLIQVLQDEGVLAVPPAAAAQAWAEQVRELYASPPN